MTCYVDTQVAVWLAQANVAKLSRRALSLIQKADVRVSPMVVVELQFLYEIARLEVTPHRIISKLSAEIGLTVCDYPFPAIAEAATGESWTRDPFDRLIVAHARANGRAPLITRDENILAHYANARS